MKREDVRSPSPFKLDVQIRLMGRVRGRRLYRVFHSGSESAVFVGTNDECKRYIAILQEKIDKQLGRKRLSRNSNKRVYRATISETTRASV